MILKDWIVKRYNTKEKQNNLRYLNCSNEGITSLEGIELLVNLKWISCHSNKLTSLKGIEKLTKLEFLFCYDNKLTSLKRIEKLTKLRRLECVYNPLPYTDLENLDKIKLEVRQEVRQEKIKKLLL